MSGGALDNTFAVLEIADDILLVIEHNENDGDSDWGEKYGCHFSKPTLVKLKQAAAHLLVSYQMAQRIDYLLSGDDSEETFHERWAAEVDEP